MGLNRKSRTASVPGAVQRCCLGSCSQHRRIRSPEDVWENNPCWECRKSKASAENDDAALFLQYFWPSQKWEVSEIS